MPSMQNWLTEQPFDAIVLDCDGTLSTIEGIDVLAEQNGVYDEVHRLTSIAMTQTGITPELYESRISLVKPTKAQLLALGQQYFFERSLDALQLVETFLSLKKAVYVVSAGINPAVKIFADLLGISEKNVFAVDAHFDAAGNYKGFDCNSPCTYRSGKRDIALELKKRHGRVLYVGDGMNDFEVHDCVDRFVGYGGNFYRENIAEGSEYYIRSASMLPLLPLALTQQEFEQLNILHRKYFIEGVEYIDRGSVLMGGVDQLQ